MLKGSLHLGHRIFGALSVLSIGGLENIYPLEHFFKPISKVLTKISRMRIWCPSRKFEMKENEMYLEKKSLLHLVLSD